MIFSELYSKQCLGKTEICLKHYCSAKIYPQMQNVFEAQIKFLYHSLKFQPEDGSQKFVQGIGHNFEISHAPHPWLCLISHLPAPP